jgi:hypothetical protein
MTKDLASDENRDQARKSLQTVAQVATLGLLALKAWLEIREARRESGVAKKVTSGERRNVAKVASGNSLGNLKTYPKQTDERAKPEKRHNSASTINTKSNPAAEQRKTDPPTLHPVYSRSWGGEVKVGGLNIFGGPMGQLPTPNLAMHRSPITEERFHFSGDGKFSFLRQVDYHEQFSLSGEYQVTNDQLLMVHNDGVTAGFLRNKGATLLIPAPDGKEVYEFRR